MKKRIFYMQLIKLFLLRYILASDPYFRVFCIQGLLISDYWLELCSSLTDVVLSLLSLRVINVKARDVLVNAACGFN